MAKKAIAKTDPRDMQIAGAKLTATGIIFSGKITFEQWVGVGQYLERCEGAVQWWIGDWLNYGEGRPQWGDKYEQAISLFNREYKTLKNYKSVSRQVELSRRRDNLSFAHHVEIAYLPEQTQDLLLDKAEPEAPDKRPRMTTREMRKAAREATPTPPPPNFPKGTYRVIYADPPWKYNDERTLEFESGAALNEYDLMTVGEICALRDIKGRTVRDLSQPSCVLFLWATSPLIPDAMAVMSAWGFRYKSTFVWDKVRTYNGHYNAVGHELLLIGTRGSCTPDTDTLQDSVVTVERTAHSKKPEEFYGIIEAMYTDGPYIELFARNSRKGWDSWGNQA